jgi:hypothetical protein
MSPPSFVIAFRAPTPQTPASHSRLPLMPSPAYPPNFHETVRGNVERFQIPVSCRIPFLNQFRFHFCKTPSLSQFSLSNYFASIFLVADWATFPKITSVTNCCLPFVPFAASPPDLSVAPGQYFKRSQSIIPVWMPLFSQIWAEFPKVVIYSGFPQTSIPSLPNTALMFVYYSYRARHIRPGHGQPRKSSSRLRRTNQQTLARLGSNVRSP